MLSSLRHFKCAGASVCFGVADSVAATLGRAYFGLISWHPGSQYKMVQMGMAGPARGLSPFPIETRMEWRRNAWGTGPQQPNQQAPAEAAKSL